MVTPAPDVEEGRARRTPSRRALPLVVAAAVAALLLAAGLLRWAGEEPTPPSSGAPTEEPDGWRTEVYRGVQVRVPADWELGGSPIPDGGSAGLVDCAEAVGDPAGGTAYVGRPVRLADTCTPVDAGSLPDPTAPYVWLGTPLPPGEVSGADGYTAETVEVGGVPVTVATDDDGLRERILRSARPLGATDPHGCPTVEPDGAGPAGGVAGEPERLSVCVYERTSAAWELLWSAETAAAAQLLEAAGGPVPGRCSRRDDGGTRVVLWVTSAEDLARYAVHLACRELRLPPAAGMVQPVVALTAETVAPWALPGVKVYVPELRTGGEDAAGGSHG